jgi:hypothetical protein
MKTGEVVFCHLNFTLFAAVPRSSQPITTKNGIIFALNTGRRRLFLLLLGKSRRSNQCIDGWDSMGFA